MIHIANGKKYSLTAAQDKLLKRIKRCEKSGYPVAKWEDRTATILENKGLIAISSLRIAWPAEA
jgi:hypothetical protein